MFYNIKLYYPSHDMIKKSTLERIIKEDLSDLWNVLTPKDKRTIIDNFHIQNFKKCLCFA